MALSIDLRKRIISAFEAGELNRRQIAQRFCVSYGSVRNLIALWRETGDVSPRYGRCVGRPPKIGPRQQEKLRELLASRCDMTLEELRDGLGLDCTVQAVHLALGRMGLTYKKDPPGQRAAARGRRGRARGLAGAADELRPLQARVHRRVRAKTNMTRLRGRAGRGARCHASAPGGRWNSTTMISSVRLDGSTACVAIPGATDTEVFRTYVREILLPTLSPGTSWSWTTSAHTKTPKPSP